MFSLRCNQSPVDQLIMIIQTYKDNLILTEKNLENANPALD